MLPQTSDRHVNDNDKIRLIAFYLPQFHPIPENDEWWGKGFTEWTNVSRARPLFRGHYQPHIPADLGFYDLRVAETRSAQAELARQYGIEGFCYYHYWFVGRRLLERPLGDVLASGEPRFPFCLCWANEDWRGVWHGAPNRLLVEQTYGGQDDSLAHFRSLLPAFLDPRYIRVDGKPLFVVYRPTEIPNAREFIDVWQNEAIKTGLNGLHLVGMRWSSQAPDPRRLGFDACHTSPLAPLRERWVPWSRPVRKITGYLARKVGRPTVYPYDKVSLALVHSESPFAEHYPVVIPNWDNTPRVGADGLVLHASTPERFRVPLRKAISLMRDCPAERRLIFVKSWNEWAEGNHLEPDLRFGRAYLEVVKQEVDVPYRPTASDPIGASHAAGEHATWNSVDPG